MRISDWSSDVCSSDLPGRRSVPPFRSRLALQQRQQLAGELLAELDAPLVEGVDAPDAALHEDLVLVEGDEAAEGARVQSAVDQGVARPVPGKDLVRQIGRAHV